MLNHAKIYIGLIITFAFLYFFTAFVSFYHAIAFFNLANAQWLSIILSLVFEVGQASVLFSVLLTDNKKKLLPWTIMIVLTALQVIGNVFASYKFISEANSPDFIYFQQSILFWVETESPEIFKVIVAWIAGALLPIIALSMTSLVAQNLKLKDENEVKDHEIHDNITVEEINENLNNFNNSDKSLNNEVDINNKVDKINIKEFNTTQHIDTQDNNTLGADKVEEYVINENKSVIEDFNKEHSNNVVEDKTDLNHNIEHNKQENEQNFEQVLNHDEELITSNNATLDNYGEFNLDSDYNADDFTLPNVNKNNIEVIDVKPIKSEYNKNTIGVPL